MLSRPFFVVDFINVWHLHFLTAVSSLIQKFGECIIEVVNTCTVFQLVTGYIWHCILRYSFFFYQSTPFFMTNAQNVLIIQ